jgi:hypothetical protein
LTNSVDALPWEPLVIERTAISPPADRLAKKFEAELAEELHPRYNIAPTQPVPVVRSSGSRRVLAPSLPSTAGRVGPAPGLTLSFVST